MATATRNKITIEYLTHGADDGVPLLLLMGLGGQLTDWPQGFIDELVAEGFFVITPDNRDQGLSSLISGPTMKPTDLIKALARRPIPHQYLLSDMAADHLAVLDDLGIQRVHVAGMSMGGMLAQELAISHPNRVLSLCSIMSTTGDPAVGRPKMKVIWRSVRNRKPIPRSKALEASVETFRMISGPTFDEPDFRERSQRSIDRSYRPDGTGRQLAAILSSGDRTGALGQVSAPTLVIHGAVDPLVTPSGGTATAKAVPGSRLIVFPEMGHDLPRGRWHEMAVAMRHNADRVADQLPHIDATSAS